MVGMRSPSELNIVILISIFHGALLIDISFTNLRRFDSEARKTFKCNSELYIIISGVYSNVTLNILHAGIMYASTYG